MQSSDDPRELHTEADRDAPLSHAEAEVAGMIEPVYAEDENADDQRDAHHAEPDEHF